MIFDRSLVVLAAFACTFAAPAALLVTPSSAYGQAVAPLLSQQPLPGAPGWTVTDVLDAPVARGDLVAAVVSASKADIGTRPGVVMWSSAGGVVTRVVPDAVVGGRAITAIPAASLRIDDLGRVLFIARDVSGDRLLRVGAASVETLASTGDAVIGTPAGQSIDLMAGLLVLDSSLRVNGSNVSLITRLSGATPPSDRALIQVSPLRAYLREGGVVGSNGVEQLQGSALASSGTIAAFSGLSSSTNSQMLWLGTSPTAAAFSGQTLAVTGGTAAVLSIDAWTMSAAGVAFRARVDASGTLTRGIWSVASGGAAPVARLLEGQNIPGLGTITSLGEATIAADGSITLAVRITGPDVSVLNDVALIRLGTGGVGAGVTVLAREGTPLSDGSGALPGLESLMLAAPRIALSGGTAGWLGDVAGQTAIYTASTTQSTRALRTGQTITTALGVATITGLSWPIGPMGGDDGRASAFTSTVVASRATMSTPGGARVALVVSTLGPAACGRADVASANQAVGPNGSLTADDIIVFLSWYFANDLRADFAGQNQAPVPNGSLTADDIIVFLSAFFAGC